MMTSTDRLDWLRQQIAQGWRVEGPVIERAVFYSMHCPANTFEFVLRADTGCQVVAVPDCSELQRFIREQALLVVSL